MASEWNVARMIELGHRHAQLEADKKLEPLMETMVDEPVYEFHPLGMKMRGGDRVKRYYTQFIAMFMQTIVGYELLGEWANEDAVVQEYDITLDVGDGPETHRVIGILFAQGELLGGERVYASERICRMMLGDLFDELEPLDPT
jgi:hypothetical protein